MLGLAQQRACWRILLAGGLSNRLLTPDRPSWEPPQPKTGLGPRHSARYWRRAARGQGQLFTGRVLCNWMKDIDSIFVIFAWRPWTSERARSPQENITKKSRSFGKGHRQGGEGAAPGRPVDYQVIIEILDAYLEGRINGKGLLAGLAEFWRVQVSNGGQRENYGFGYNMTIKDAADRERVPTRRPTSPGRLPQWFSGEGGKKERNHDHLHVTSQ